MELIRPKCKDILLSGWILRYNDILKHERIYFRKKSQVVTSLKLNGVLLSGMLGLCTYGGMVMYAFYHDCDPIKAEQVVSGEQMFPLFVMQLVGDVPGVPGLFVAGVFRYLLLTQILQGHFHLIPVEH